MLLSLFDSPTIVAEAVDHAEAARAAGFDRFWMPQVMNADTMVTLGVVASRVPDIGLGTSVMAMQTMLPQTMAQQARTVNQISGGRLTLGIGVNHEPVVTARWGLPWDKPYSRFVEYLDALLPLLEHQAVETSGTWVSHSTMIDVPSEAPDVMLAALGPRMLALAAERTSGTITWMTGPTTIESHIRPGCVGGRVVAGVPVVITDDVDAARSRVNRLLAIYPQLPSYRAVMEREGASEAADMCLIGSIDEVAAGLARYRDAGADEVAVNLLVAPEALAEAIGAVGALRSSLAPAE